MTDTLHLLIPGLLGPWPKVHPSDFPALATPALQHLLNRAQVEEEVEQGLEANLCALFSVFTNATVEHDLPIAALTCLADGGEPGEHFWLRADPVHLSADMNRVVLFDARMLDLQADEAADLVADCNRQFAASDWQLEALHPHRWYLRLRTADTTQLITTPLPDAIGKDINPLLPGGADKERWHTLLTEVQMVLHQSDVNSEREWDNQLPVNSIWLWGGGRLPSTIAQPYTHVYGSDALTQGLSQLARLACRDVPANALQWHAQATAGSNNLIVLETIRYYIFNDDLYRWCDRLRSLEQDWFAPCLQLLKQGRLRRLLVSACNGQRYIIERRHLRRFWRAKRAINDYFELGTGLIDNNQVSTSHST